MKGTPPLCPNDGFSLIESMLALVILSIGILAMARLQIAAIRGNALSQRMTTAVSIAEQKIEELKNTPYDNIQAESTAPVPNQNFTRQVTVASGPLPDTKTVSVIVNWQGKSKTYTFPIATIIGK